MANTLRDLIGLLTFNAGQLVETAAGTDTEVMFRVPVELTSNVSVETVYVTPIAAHTGANTNFMSLEIHDGGALGTGTTEIVAGVDYTSTVDLVAGTTVVFTPTTAYAVSAGDIIRVRVVHSGTGNASPRMDVQVVLNLGAV